MKILLILLLTLGCVKETHEIDVFCKDSSSLKWKKERDDRFKKSKDVYRVKRAIEISESRKKVL
jgi:hypothetical protein